MSQRDRDFLKKASLRVTDVASALGIKPQAISQGLSRKSDYFNNNRIACMRPFISEHFPHILTSFDESVVNILGYMPDEVLRQRLVVKYKDDKGIFKDVQNDVLIFSANPEEISDRSVLIQMAKLFREPSSRFEYFTSCESSQTLLSLFRVIFHEIKGECDDYAEVNIYEMPSVEYGMPFFIHNPLCMEDRLQGYVIINSDFVLMGKKQLMPILNKLISIGIGLSYKDKEVILSGVQKEKQKEVYSLVFASREE